MFSDISLCCLDRPRNFMTTFFPQISKWTSSFGGHLKWSLTASSTLFVSRYVDIYKLLFGCIGWLYSGVDAEVNGTDADKLYG